MSNLYDYDLNCINGKALPLKEFDGQVVLLVNVASKCGLTPQYEQLEALYQKYKPSGFSVLGIPCNQFAGQEPWPEDQILAFCQTEYAVSFPLSSKVDVNGDNKHPLYEWLTGEQAKFPGDISWNFEKFLVNRKGEVCQRFEPSLEPNARAVIKAIEETL